MGSPGCGLWTESALKNIAISRRMASAAPASGPLRSVFTKAPAATGFGGEIAITLASGKILHLKEGDCISGTTTKGEGWNKIIYMFREADPGITVVPGTTVCTSIDFLGGDHLIRADFDAIVDKCTDGAGARVNDTDISKCLKIITEALLGRTALAAGGLRKRRNTRRYKKVTRTQKNRRKSRRLHH